MSSSFLATTALDEFWNKDADRILFLGTWCLRFDSRHRWENLRYEVLPSPWNDRRRFYEAAAYVDELGERLLPPLARYLNSVHGQQHSDRYWRILIGVWLTHAVHAAYDRYVLLAEAIGTAPVQTIGLDRSDYRVPTTTVDHHAALKNDLYNLQLFTQILEAQGHEFPRRKASSPPPPHALYRRSPVKKVIVSSVERLARFGERLLEKPGRIAFYSSYGSWSAELRILLQSGFGVIPMHPPAVHIEREPVFDSRRLGLADLPASSPFERILVGLLPHLFPTIFLEGYRELVSSCAAPSVGGVASVSGWYFEEHVKCRAAILADRGAKMFALQHGGGYGMYRVTPAERYERRLSDRFLVWGWAGDDPKLRNVPGARLSEIAKDQISISSASRNRSVLFVPTAHPRYLYRFHSSPVGSQWSEYFDWQLRFLGGLAPGLRREVLYCLMPLDLGHCEKERIVSRFPDVRVDASVPAPKRFSSTRISVIDHCATTLLESLAANLPTILYWDPQRWEMRDEAEEMFAKLRECGVLFDTPESAAAQLSAVYADPARWWDDKSLQAVRREFVCRYVMNSPSWPRQWASTMLSDMNVTGTATEARRAAL